MFLPHLITAEIVSLFSHGVFSFILMKKHVSCVEIGLQKTDFNRILLLLLGFDRKLSAGKSVQVFFFVMYRTFFCLTVSSFN